MLKPGSPTSAYGRSCCSTRTCCDAGKALRVCRSLTPIGIFGAAPKTFGRFEQGLEAAPFDHDFGLPRGARIAYSPLESSARKSRPGTFARFDSYWIRLAATTWRAISRDVYCASVPVPPKGFRSAILVSWVFSDRLIEHFLNYRAQNRRGAESCLRRDSLLYGRIRHWGRSLD